MNKKFTIKTKSGRIDIIYQDTKQTCNQDREIFNAKTSKLSCQQKTNLKQTLITNNSNSPMRRMLIHGLLSSYR